MNYLRFLFFILFFSHLSTTLFSQKIVAFNKRGKIKRVRYYEREFIRLKMLNGDRVEGEISTIKETSFMVGFKEVKLDSVAKVYNTQKYYGFDIVARFTIVGGTLYFPLDTFNRLINNDDPLVSGNSAAVSGALLGVGLLCTAIVNKGYKISEKRPLKIIDLTI